MAEYIQWDVVTKGSEGNGEKGEYLRLQSGNTYRIRPLFKLVKFYKYFHKKDGKLRTAICQDPRTCPVRDKHPDLQKPSLRFASYIIDRKDGKVKILEGPQTVFRPLGSSFEMTGKEPGGSKDGSDWSIKVTGKGYNTKYDVVFIENTPITKEERELITEAVEGDKEKLAKVYKDDTPEQIEEKLFGEWKGKEESQQQESTASKESDDFDNNW